MDNNIVSLSRVEETGEWVLWRFVLIPRTLRFVWVKSGEFPVMLFSESAVRDNLAKTYDSAAEQKDKWDKLSSTYGRRRM